MDAPKTYFILHSTDYVPDDLIQLGQLIADPRRPYRRIVAPLRTSPAFPRIHDAPPVDNWQHTEDKACDGGVGLFANFYNLLTANLGVQAFSTFRQSWQAATLQTHFIELGEAQAENLHSQGYIQDLVALSAVQAWICANRRLGRPLYLVTGIKVLQPSGPTTQSTSRSTKLEASLEPDPIIAAVVGALATTTGGPPVLPGVQAHVARDVATDTEGTPQNAFVFAYRLRKVYIGWRSKKGRLGDDVVKGADLHGVPGGGDGAVNGVGPAGRRVQDNEADNDDADHEIEEIFLEDGDFGMTLPEDDEKLVAIDEAEGRECFVVIPQDEDEDED